MRIILHLWGNVGKEQVINCVTVCPHRLDISSKRTLWKKILNWTSQTTMSLRKKMDAMCFHEILFWGHRDTHGLLAKKMNLSLTMCKHPPWKRKNHRVWASPTTHPVSPTAIGREGPAPCLCKTVELALAICVKRTWIWGQHWPCSLLQAALVS